MQPAHLPPSALTYLPSTTTPNFPVQPFYSQRRPTPEATSRRRPLARNPRQLTNQAKHPPSAIRLSRSASPLPSLCLPFSFPYRPTRPQLCCPPALSSQYPVTRRLPALGQSLPAKSRPHATPTLVVYSFISFLLPSLSRCWSIRRVKTPLRSSTSTGADVATALTIHNHSRSD